MCVSVASCYKVYNPKANIAHNYMPFRVYLMVIPELRQKIGGSFLVSKTSEFSIFYHLRCAIFFPKQFFSPIIINDVVMSLVSCLELLLWGVSNPRVKLENFYPWCVQITR